MRLWSIHPKYLDSKGLIALWREALLAQKVLSGKTKGYRNHPQLERFKSRKDPLKTIGFYLGEIRKESKNRGYNFDSKKVLKPCFHTNKINITSGQIEFEFRHLQKKLRQRDLIQHKSLLKLKKIKAHSLFKIVVGKKADWER